jgi:hypothetical protein
VACKIGSNTTLGRHTTFPFCNLEIYPPSSQNFCLLAHAREFMMHTNRRTSPSSPRGSLRCLRLFTALSSSRHKIASIGWQSSGDIAAKAELQGCCCVLYLPYHTYQFPDKRGAPKHHHTLFFHYRLVPNYWIRDFGTFLVCLLSRTQEIWGNGKKNDTCACPAKVKKSRCHGYGKIKLWKKSSRNNVGADLLDCHVNLQVRENPGLQYDSALTSA